MPKSLIPIIIIAVIIITIKLLKPNRRTRTPIYQSREPIFKNEKKTEEIQFPYKAKTYIMSKAELSFYHCMKYTLEDNHIIFTKVRIEDIIYVPKGTREHYKYRNYIKSRHIDFVICDSKTGKIQRAVELNDSSHKRQDRKKRDEFINKAFKEAGIKLLTMKCKASYSMQDIHDLFYKNSEERINTSCSNINV